MLAMDAALLVLKDAGFSFSDLPLFDMDRGSYRSVYPHPTNPEEVVKVPRASLDDRSMIDVASSQAMSAVGEPVIPERLDTIQRNVMVADPATSEAIVGGTTPQPVFLQQRLPYGPATQTSGSVPYGDARAVVRGAMRDFAPGNLTGPEAMKLERLANVLGTDLHDRNFGFKIPNEEVKALAEKGDKQALLDNLVAFDAMSTIRPRTTPEDSYSSGDIARMMRAGDIDPEKLNRFMELFADRSQFDPLMDAIAHQPLPSSPHSKVEREALHDRVSIEDAYNAYIRAVNNAKRTKSYIDDPYQTRLMEYDMTPLDEAPRNLGNAHPATVLREAIIRARAQQAQDALEERTPMSVAPMRRSISHLRDLVGRDLRNELMGENTFGEMPNIGRLLGPEQERRQMIDTAARKKQQEEIDWI